MSTSPSKNGEKANTSVDKQALDMLARAGAAADQNRAEQGGNEANANKEPTMEELEAIDAMLQLRQEPTVPPGGMKEFEASMKAGQDAVERPAGDEKK